MTQRQWSEAKADFGKAISEALAHKEVNILRGEERHWRGGRSLSPINEPKKAVEIDPGLNKRWFVLGDEFMKLDQKSDAIDSYSPLEWLETKDVPREGPADSIRRLERTVVAEQTSPLQLILSKGAGRDVRPSQAKKPPPNSEDPALTAQENGDYAKAVELYRKYITSEPNNPKHHSNLAIVLELLGRYEEAITEYEAAINLNPRDSAAMVAIGDIYSISLGDDRSALSWYAKAIQTEPDEKKKKAIGERIGKFMLGEKALR
ncbi:MAG: tetratricopeptide repeat protein [Desulfomonilaceae bacterium]